MSLRQVIRSAAVSSIQYRCYVTPSAALLQKDILQDIALKEIRNYKPTVEKPTDPTLLKDFKPPAPPSTPKVQELSAAELEAYDNEDDVYEAPIKKSSQ
ncbi:hypothetical protein BKA69DRAFT_1176003 [Paraphysoderma sedebokerense]|nr:hypothetical protein BKA69DRAFT_1176003 [Paraphysoderma sedebokerense]